MSILLTILSIMLTNTTSSPFPPNWFDHPDGKLHYVDQGAGPAVVFVHGTPTSSYLYRNMIRVLSSSHRCIAIDHLGFGLSDKPISIRSNGVDYSPKAHAERLGALIDELKLDSFSLVVHDFGGPIGLGSVLHSAERLERLDKLAIFNTWAWSNSERGDVKRLVKMLDGPIGRFLYYRLNFSTRVLLPSVFHDKEKLTKQARRYYQNAFPTRASRRAPHEMGRHLLDPWIGDLEPRLNALHDHDTLLLWGMHDPTFKRQDLTRWQELLPSAEVEELEAGHFPQEELPEQVNAALRRLFA